MPFTLSHAAAALPFRRTRLVISAVVFGSFAPDFEYFIPFWHHGAFGHRLPGIFAFDLPAAFLALWLFQRYARDPLAALLPRGARERLHLGSDTLDLHSFSRLILITFSILVGIATHILWDSFTHPHYWLYEHWPPLHTFVWLPLFGARPLYGILQYISSALGLLIILLWFGNWYRSTPPVHSQPDRPSLTRDRLALAGAFAIASIGAFIRAAAVGLPNGVHGSQRFLTDLAETGLTLLWIGIVLYGMVRHHSLDAKKPVSSRV